MPYARVGALPQPSNDDEPMAGGRTGKPQGITMEDLKKQTAMRLAQEQDQGGAPEFNNTRMPNDRNMQIYDLKRQTALRLAQEQELSRTANQSYDRNMQILPPEQLQYQHPYVASQAFSPVDPNRVPQDSAKFNQPAEKFDMAVNTSMKPNSQTQYLPHRSNPVPPPSRAVDRSSQRNPATNRPGSSLSTGSANSYGSGSTERKGRTKPKLPHGLTVQELKEMTKARLQAEAAEGSLEPEIVQPSGVAFPSQPFGRGSGEAVSPLGFVQESGVPLGSISPHQSNMMASGRDGMIQSRDSWQHSGGVDGWDTASVASTANSDYLGSESPYSSSFQQHDEIPGVPFSRSRSYGGGYEQQQEAAPYFASTSPFAELTGGQNRRRASTLSPRPGSGLTYLHEDRPLCNTTTAVGLPSFDAAARAPHRIPINTEQSSSQTSSPARFFAGSTEDASRGAVGGIGLSNRPRTASAPTVRPVSQPSDGFARSDALAHSTHSLGLQGDGAFESALGLSATGGDETDAFSSVFREPTGPHRPPPGLFPNAESSGPGSLSGSRSNDFGYDDSWGKPAIGSRSREYQSRARAHTDGEALLADSLGSMLNLSATRQPSIGHNTFVSRIDPEVDSNRRRAATSSPVSPSPGAHAFSTNNDSLFQRGAFRDDNSRYM